MCIRKRVCVHVSTRVCNCVCERVKERGHKVLHNQVHKTFLSFSSRMIEVQVQMAQRAIELLALPEETPSYILDVG